MFLAGFVPSLYITSCVPEISKNVLIDCYMNKNEDTVVKNPQMKTLVSY